MKTQIISVGLWFMALTIGAATLWPSQSQALSLCGTRPSSFSLDSIQVRLDGESEFSDVASENFCYTMQQLDFPGISSIRYYIVGLNTVFTSNQASYPGGSEFKIHVTNLDSKFKIGGVIASADNTIAQYGDQIGGSANEISITIKSFADSTFSTIYIAAIDDSTTKSSMSERVILAQNPENTIGFPMINYNADSVEFTLDHAFQGCPHEDKAYDSFIDGFFPLVTLGHAGLSKNLLEFLDDEMLPLIFSTSSSEGMLVTNLAVRKSYGERQSSDGLPNSDQMTGLVIRMELKNNGWGYTPNNKTCEPGSSALSSMFAPSIMAKSGGFRIKPAARVAIKTCTFKKKMKKGYSFKKKGKNIVCKRKTAR